MNGWIVNSISDKRDKNRRPVRSCMQPQI